MGCFFKIHCCLWAGDARGNDVQLKGPLAAVVQPGFPGCVLWLSGGTGTSCVTAEFILLEACVFVYFLTFCTSKELGRQHFVEECVLSAQKYKWRKLGHVCNEEGCYWWKFHSTSIIRQHNKVVRGKENSRELKTQRRTASEKSARALIAKRQHIPQ